MHATTNNSIDVIGKVSFITRSTVCICQDTARVLPQVGAIVVISSRCERLAEALCDEV